MVAGPYPTKAMFEGLKGRVTAIEVAGVGGGAAPQPTLGWYTTEPQGPMDLSAAHRLTLRWERRTLALAGLTLPGNIELEGVALYGPNAAEGPETFFSASDMKRTLLYTGVNQRTNYMFPRTALLTDGQMTLLLPAGTQLRTSAPIELPTAMQLELVNQDTGQKVGAYPEWMELYETPYEGVPVVPVPTSSESPILDYQQVTPPRRVELVWPASGNPYLHVIEFSSIRSGGADFYVPLTPGLPQ